ncbi:MAG TPA: asparagine synthase-related protein [Rhizomicrobium sp.]|jgi:asparagine synthase (glutamine-hydrolysing)|nr:asparagine synthase-related protein [Rhizomicrobium sp.]
MSGICGIIRFDGRSVPEGDLERQMNAMAHLGPDRRRLWRDGGAGFGHLLMRVTQEDSFDAQPIVDRTAGLVLVADVRLDNREELAAALAIETDVLRDMPDGLLVMRAYKAWGEMCADRLLGDFAFAVWDMRAKSLVLARDHMGQRHIAFHRGDGFFAFATEIKGLWALGEVPRVVVESLYGRAASLNRSQEIAASPYEGIAAMAGGTVISIAADGAMRTRRYWTPHADPAHLGRDEAYYIDAYRRVLGEAVACRIRRATQPAALFYGGGFDSTAIAALAGPVVSAQRRKFVCVCSVMPEDYKGTIRHARPWAELCARHMPHVDMRLVTREGRTLFTAMEKSFQAADNATSTGGYITDQIHSTMVAAGARVAMDGYGGDYTLNVRNYPWLFALLRGGRLNRFASEFAAYRRHSGLSRWRVLRDEVLKYLVPEALRRARIRRRHGLALWSHTTPIKEEYAGNTRNALRGRQATPTTEAAMRAHLLAIINRLQRGRSLAGSMQAASRGLEFTQPFHDKRVIELALAIPADLWVKDGRERHLAREALKDLYPPEFQTRRRGNTDIAPDFLAMVKSVEPQLLAEIDRMERDGKLSHIFDFPRMREMLTRRTIDQHHSGSEYDTHQAITAFMQARFLEWFRRENR